MQPDDRDDIAFLLQLSMDPDPKVRKTVVRDLCPCELKFNDQIVWDRLIKMASDSDVEVRRHVLHVLCDGSPRERKSEVVQALERMYHDPDLKLRRQVRKTLARYKHTGRINVL